MSDNGFSPWRDGGTPSTIDARGTTCSAQPAPFLPCPTGAKAGVTLASRFDSGRRDAKLQRSVLRRRVEVELAGSIEARVQLVYQRVELLGRFTELE